jgi:hypothetical protein
VLGSPQHFSFLSNMSWEFYEVWSVDEDDHEELVDTTQSLKEAQEIAETTLGEDGVVESIIYRENDIGDLEEVQRIT